MNLINQFRDPFLRFNELKKLIGQQDQKKSPQPSPAPKKVEPVQETDKPKKKRKRKTMMDEPEPVLGVNTLLGEQEKRRA